MNPTAIYSKSGKGVQEASGKTSLLQRPDRAVLSGIDGRATLAEVAQKVGRSFDAAFEAVIAKLDKDGFIREVSGGVAAAPPSRPAAPASRPGAAGKKPMSGGGGLDELDFTSIGGVKPATQRPAAAAPPSRPAAPAPRPAAPPAPPPPPKEDQSALTRAREEAEARAAAERERLKAEAEAKTRAEMEAKLRAEAEQKLKEEAEARARAEAEAQVRAAREAAVRAAAEAKARVEAEAKAKLEAERRAREETERRLEAERKAREEAERKAREAAERARREAEEKARREAEELRQRLEEERKAREEAERKAKEEAERARRELEEERRRIEAERKREEEERRREEEERAARRKREEEQAREREEEAEREAKRKLRDEAPVRGAAPKAEAKKEDSFADSLLSDLESFTNRDEDERKEREAAERKAKAEAERRAQEEEQREAERREREDEERRRRDEEARRAREEEERRAQEDERRRREAEEIRRKAEAATAAAMAKEGKGPAGAEEDIPVGDDDLGMDEVRREQAALDKGKPKPEREKKKKKKPVEAEAPVKVARGKKGGPPIVMTLVLLLAVAIGVAHLVPLGTADYERAATEALGRPVKIGSARLWLFTGLELRMQDVRVGDASMSHVKGSPSIGTLFGERKEFSRLELDGFKLPQASLADAIFAPVRGDNFRVERIVVKKLELPGPAALPKDLQADILLDAKGVMRSATVRGPDGLVAKLAPKESGIDFEVVAAGFPLPIAPQIVLSNFGMKGSATPRGMRIADWGGTLYSGAVSGTANVQWGRSWTMDGVITVRGINAAVFAPALLSEGTAEGTGKFSMSAPDPSGLMEASRVDGTFTVNRGALGSFDLARVIQTNGKEAAGRTQFTEMTGQGTYDHGAVALRNVTLGAGLLNAGASADIARNGALSGRIIADVKTSSQTLRATLLLGGTVKDPQVRN